MEDDTSRREEEDVPLRDLNSRDDSGSYDWDNYQENRGYQEQETSFTEPSLKPRS